MSNEVRKYWMTAGQVVYRLQDDESGEIHVLPINAVHKTVNDFLTATDLGMIQRGMQHQAANRFEKPVEFVDVHISHISPMGYMTEDQFNDQPAPAQPSNDPVLEPSIDPLQQAQ